MDQLQGRCSSGALLSCHLLNALAELRGDMTAIFKKFGDFLSEEVSRIDLQGAKEPRSKA